MFMNLCTFFVFLSLIEFAIVSKVVAGDLGPGLERRLARVSKVAAEPAEPAPSGQEEGDEGAAAAEGTSSSNGGGGAQKFRMYASMSPKIF